MADFKDRVSEIGKEGWRELEIVEAGDSGLIVGDKYKVKVNFADNPSEPGTMFSKANIATEEQALDSNNGDKILTALSIKTLIEWVESNRTGDSIFSTTTGTSNNYISTFERPFESLEAGMIFNIVFNAENTGISTLTIDSNGAKYIKKYNSLGKVELEGGEITQKPYTIIYDGVDFIILTDIRRIPKRTIIKETDNFIAPITGYYEITVVGAGGSGANCDGGSTATGGGGGGLSKKIIKLTKNETILATVGIGGEGQTVAGNNGNDGGSSSFGSHCSATGGTRGYYYYGSTVATSSGGIGVGGDINLAGNKPEYTVRPVGGSSVTLGGDSPFGTYVNGLHNTGAGSSGNDGTTQDGEDGIIIVEYLD